VTIREDKQTSAIVFILLSYRVRTCVKQIPIHPNGVKSVCLVEWLASLFVLISGIFFLRQLDGGSTLEQMVT
jgi:hypothetical protein